MPFVDLDRHFADRVGEISEYIGRHGYEAYARENVEAYCSLFRGETRPDVVALSSGFMTYSSDAHPEYARVRREIEEFTHTFVLLPSLDRELCVAEIVRRQVARPFGTRFMISLELAIGHPRARLAQILDLFSEDSWRNVYAGELEVHPPGAPTTRPGYSRHG